MHQRKLTRYFCDHCSKGGFKMAVIQSHEKSCCQNPDRVCAWHGGALRPRVSMEELIEAIEGDHLDELRTVAGGCPWCMLAAIKQSPQPDNSSAMEDGYWENPLGLDFDFKAERERFLASDGVKSRAE